MKHREERRRFWLGVVAQYEKSGMSRKEFAVEAGVGLAIFQYWLYKIRRERKSAVVTAVGSARAPEVRLVPVRVTPRVAAPVRLDVYVGAVRLRVPVGADPSYVAQLAAALGGPRLC